MTIKFDAVKKATMPNVMMTVKYIIMTVHTRHPPQVLTKNKNMIETIRVINKTVKAIGHVLFMSLIDF